MIHRSVLLTVLITALLLPQAVMAATDPPEIRASWVYGFGSEFANPTATTVLVNTLADNNFNVIIPEIRKAGDAYYNSAYEPWASDVAAGYDPLQDMIEKAHAKNMEVYAWLVTYRIWTRGKTTPTTHIWAQHPEWACVSSAGSNVNGSYYDLDPGVPGVQDYIAKVAIDIISKYDVDGINFDYIRYSGNNWGYNAISKERFKSEYGFYPPTAVNLADPQYLAWNEWKRKQVTNLVKKIYLETMWRKPHVKMTVDTIGWQGGDPNTDFTQTRAYADVCQDHKSWMEQHIIDMSILMNYNRDWTGQLSADTNYYYKGRYWGNQRANHRMWSDFLASMQTTTGRSAVDGIAGYLNIMQGCLDQWTYSRANGIGLGVYRYGFTIAQEDLAAPGYPVLNTSGVAAHGNEGLFYDTVKSTVFQNPAPVPDMPWKSSPTTGIIFGTVTDASEPNDPVYQNWVYQGTVTLTGPYPSLAVQTTETDATGTYGFIDVQPGVYSITAEKPGLLGRTYTGQVLRAGDVVREDFDLGYTTATIPDGSIVAGANCFSLPLEPVNPSPASVLAGLTIDGSLTKYDNPTQARITYQTSQADSFGGLSMLDGYMLTSSAPGTISYQAYGGGPAMRDISVPKSGWALMGCPFPRTLDWENALVTKDGVTVDLRTASQHGNNWMSSLGYWWNAAEQTQYDMGFWDDWPSGGTTLVPWRAYWIQTFQDGITLTLR